VCEEYGQTRCKKEEQADHGNSNCPGDEGDGGAPHTGKQYRGGLYQAKGGQRGQTKVAIRRNEEVKAKHCIVVSKDRKHEACLRCGRNTTVQGLSKSNLFWGTECKPLSTLKTALEAGHTPICIDKRWRCAICNKGKSEMGKTGCGVQARTGVRSLCGKSMRLTMKTNPLVAAGFVQRQSAEMVCEAHQGGAGWGSFPVERTEQSGTASHGIGEESNPKERVSRTFSEAGGLGDVRASKRRRR
jgi:hypothetical protein